MSNYFCEKCGKAILEGPDGNYTTECKHYPMKGEKAMDLDLRSFKFYLAGVQHHNYRDVTKEMAEGDFLEIVPEPTNKYDPNAIRLHYDSVVLNMEVMLGYVPKKKSAEIADFLKKAQVPACKVISFDPGQSPWNMIKVEIGELELLDQSDEVPF